MSDTPRGLKLAGCGNHPERTDLSCFRIRRLDGTALTVAEVWAELAAAQAEIAELRAKCERLEKVNAPEIIAFSNWYTSAWNYDAYEAKEEDVRRMWAKWQGWLRTLNEPHCGDCTKVPAPCTRCHTEEYLKFAELVRAVTSANPGGAHE